MNIPKSINILIHVLCLSTGWCFSQAYIVGPKLHYKRGYDDAMKQVEVQKQALTLPHVEVK